MIRTCVVCGGQVDVGETSAAPMDFAVAHRVCAVTMLDDGRAADEASTQAAFWRARAIELGADPGEFKRFKEAPWSKEAM